MQSTYFTTVSHSQVTYILLPLSLNCKSQPELRRVLTIVAKATADLYRTVSPKESCIAIRSVK